MTTVLTTLHPKLEIDGRPISRLLSTLTPPQVILFLPLLCLSCPLSHSRWLANLQLVYRGCNQAVLGLHWAGLGQGWPEKWLAPCSTGPRRESRHLLGPPSDRHLTSHGEGDWWDSQKTNTQHTHTEEPSVMLFSCLVSSLLRDETGQSLCICDRKRGMSQFTGWWGREAKWQEEGMVRWKSES